MANRFWVGGTGTWDAATTTHWSATSGGAGGASVPTSADDVLIDGSSGGGVISLGAGGVCACRSFSTTGFVGSLSWGNLASVNLRIGDALGGALTTGAGTTIANISNTVNAIIFAASTDNGGVGWPITTNGVQLPSMTFGYNGTVVVLGGRWQLQDNLSWANGGTGQLLLNAGTLDTNSKNLTGWQMNISTANVRSLILGSSVITLSSTGSNAWASNTVSNLTFNAGTSRIVLTGATGGLQTGQLTFYDLVFSGAGKQFLLGISNPTITCHNLTVTSVWLAIGLYTPLLPQGLLVVTGTATYQGTSLAARLMVSGTDAGSGSVPIQTPIQAAAVVLSNVDFRDINASGAVPWTGTSVGDMQGNTGITFDASQTRYWVGGTGNWDDTAHWSATSGGAGGASIPLSQDDVFFNASSGGGIVNARVPRMGRNIDFTGFTGTFETAGVGATVDHYCFGNLTLGAGMTMSGINNVFLGGRGSFTLTSNGKAFTQSVLVFAPGGTYTLAGDLTIPAALSLSLDYGTFDAAGFNVTTGRHLWGHSSASFPPLLVKMGSGTWTVTGPGTSAPLAIISGPTSQCVVQASTSTIVFTSTALNNKQFAVTGGAALVLNVVRHSGGGDMQFVNGGCIVNSLIIDPPTGPVSRGFSLNSNTTMTFGAMTCVGAQGMPVTIKCSTQGGRGNIVVTTGAVAMRFVTIADMAFSGGAMFTATNSANLGNVTGVDFGHTPLAIARTLAGARAAAADRPVAVGQSALAYLALGPILHYRFGEKAGTTAVAMVGPNGLVKGSVLPTWGTPGLVPGDSDTALLFDGVARGVNDQCVQVTMPNAGPATGITVVAWVRMDGVPTNTYESLLNWSTQVATVGYHWVYFQTTSIWYQFADGTVRTAQFVTANTLGTPYFIAMAHDFVAKTLSLYKNGALVQTQSLAAFGAPLVAPAASPLTIGAYSGLNYEWNGALDELAVFPRALAASEVTSLYIPPLRRAA
jgi:hypothetical protein